MGTSPARFRARWTWAVLLLLLTAPLGQAAHDGPTFLVDPQASEAEDLDGDHHFRTLTALLAPGAFPKLQPNDLVVLKPGTHRGPWTLRVAGVTVRSQQGRAQTQLLGRFDIAAKQVRLEGVTVDADGAEAAVVVREQDVHLVDVRATGATRHGISVEAPRATIHGLDASHNGAVGLWAGEDANDLRIRQSRFQANGRHGLALEGARAASVRDCLFLQNGTSGARLQSATDVELAESRFEANSEHGLQLVESAHNEVARNAFRGNGVFGLYFENSSQNRALGNQIQDNGGSADRSGGVMLQASVENALADNTIEGHSGASAAGVWFWGDTSANVLRGNALSGNAVGVVLHEDGAGNVPQANDVEGNAVHGSHGAGIWSRGINNRYADNEVEGNNGPGFLLEHTEDERLEANVVRGNGEAGVRVDGAVQLRLSANRLEGNARGLLAEDLAYTELDENVLVDNGAEGARIVGGHALKLRDNVFRANGKDGLWLEKTEGNTLTGNAFEDNRDVATQLEHTADTEALDNAFRRNRGGVTVWGGERVLLQYNVFDDNEGFGAWAMDVSELDARYNYWGGPEGPSGLAPSGRYDSDLVKDIPFEAAFPWLPAPPGTLEPRSLRGWALDPESELGWVHAPGAQLALDLSGLRATSRGWLIALRPEDRPAGAPPLGQELSNFDLYAGGTLTGSVGLRLRLAPETIPAEAPLETLRLFRWDSARWVDTEAELDRDGKTLHLELAVDALEAAAFILAWPQERRLSPSSWVEDSPSWIVGEPFDVRLRDPDKNWRGDRADRIHGAVALLDDEGNALVAFDAVETGADTGVFRLQWPANAHLTFAGGERLRLRYVDPEDATDASETTLAVHGREPFALDPGSAEGEDADGDFVYRTLGAALAGVPGPQPGEAVRLLPGTHEGNWTVDVPGLQLWAEPGAVLRGALHVRADGVIVTGLAMDSSTTGVRVEGSGVRFERVTLDGALRVDGAGFRLIDSEMSAASAGITLRGEDAQLIRNAIQGTPALVAHGVRVRAQRNWWGQASGPGDVQGVTQEDVFPWLLAPPAAATHDGHVEGATWSGHGPGEILSDMGQALLALDLPRLWESFQRLFGQGAETIPLDGRWSLRVLTSEEGRLIAERDRHGLADWMPAHTQRLGVWTDPTRETGLRLVFDGADRPRVWGAQDGGWTALEVVRAGLDRWRVNLPRPADAAPLWLAVSDP